MYKYRLTVALLALSIVYHVIAELDRTGDSYQALELSGRLLWAAWIGFAIEKYFSRNSEH